MASAKNTSSYPHFNLIQLTSINLLLIINFHDDKLLTHSKRGECGGDELAEPVRMETHDCFISYALNNNHPVRSVSLALLVDMCYYRRRSYGLGKPCSSRLSTLQMAATVGWESEVSLRVRSSLGISWNSLSSLAFLAASLFNTNKVYTHQQLAEIKKKSQSCCGFFFSAYIHK